MTFVWQVDFVISNDRSKHKDKDQQRGLTTIDLISRCHNDTHHRGRRRRRSR